MEQAAVRALPVPQRMFERDPVAHQQSDVGRARLRHHAQAARLGCPRSEAHFLADMPVGQPA